MVSRYIGAFECSAHRACGLSRNVFVRQLCLLNPDMPPVPSEGQHERLEPTQTPLLKDRRFKLSRSVTRSPPPLAMTSANPVGPTCQSVRSMQVSKLVELFVPCSHTPLFQGVDASSATRATRANRVVMLTQHVPLKKQERSLTLINQSMLAVEHALPFR